jgi:hypothetical protein
MNYKIENELQNRKGLGSGHGPVEVFTVIAYA